MLDTKVKEQLTSFTIAAKVELARREYNRRNLAELAESLKDFTFFAEYVSQRFGKPDYKHYPFSRLICKELEEWAKADNGRLRVNCPPRVGKTENSVVLNTLYIMTMVNRRAAVGYVTYGSALSLRTLSNSGSLKAAFNFKRAVYQERGRVESLTTYLLTILIEIMSRLLAPRVGVRSGYTGKGRLVTA